MAKEGTRKLGWIVLAAVICILVSSSNQALIPSDPEGAPTHGHCTCCQPGQTGPSGQPGIPGIPGLQGAFGPKGDPGLSLKGPKGDIGQRGPHAQGERGEPGVRGLPGKMGPVGVKGDTGDRGQPGAMAEKGQKGQSGETSTPPAVVAFDAYHGSDKTSGGRIIFDTVELNQGNAYDSQTGVFNCSIPGVYFFTVSIFGKSFSAKLMKNEYVVLNVRDDNSSDYQQSSASAVVVLATGDTLLVNGVSSRSGRRIGGGSSKYTRFSGFLISKLQD